jgi:cell division septation protein DedD
MAAKEASKNAKKDMLIFFSKSTCSTCDEGWSAFEKDPLAPKLFISTIVDTEDFDGMVIMDKYQLNKAPSWVILTYDGKVLDKWEGGWRDSSGKTSLLSNETPKKPVQPEVVKPVSTPTTSTNVSSPVVNTEMASAPSKVGSPVMPTPPPTITKAPEVASGNFVLQAGYFGSEANAQKLVDDLKGKGYVNYSIKSTVQNGTTYYRVISAPFISETDANKEIQSLAGSGVKATMKNKNEL